MEDILKLHDPTNALARIQFTVPGKPHGKGRPRFTEGGIPYTDTKTRNYESLIAMVASQAWPGEPLESPVSLEVVVVLALPKAFSKRRRVEALNGHIEPTKKPDVDNVAKAIMDGIEGIVYKRDAQVTRLAADKIYGLKEEVRVLVIESPMKGL